MRLKKCVLKFCHMFWRQEKSFALEFRKMLKNMEKIEFLEKKTKFNKS